ncbi:MAG: PilZ domain-containing protein [Pirellulaceae bacterium]
MQITHENPTAEEDLERMRDMLDQWRRLSTGKRDERRCLPRHDYATTAIVSVDYTPSDAKEESGPKLQAVFESWTRDLSATGVSLLFPRHLSPQSESKHERAETIDLYEVLNRGDEIQVGLPKSAGRILWMRSVIRRLRRVQDFVLDCGVQFAERL